MNKDKLTLFTICSGGGILEHGAIKAGLTPIGGVEIDPKIAKLHKLNYPNSNLIIENVSRVDWYGLSSPFFLHASPSCRNFSNAGKRKEQLSDRAVAQGIGRAIAVMQPKVFTLENATNYKGSQSWNAIKNVLAKHNYSLVEHKINFKHWGIPQKQRVRLIAIAVKDEEVPKITTPNRTTRWYEEIQDLIPDLEPSQLTNTQEKYLTDQAKVAIANGETVLLKRNQIGSRTPCAYESEPFCWSITATLGTDQKNSNRNLFADLVTPDGIFKATPRLLARIQTIDDSYRLTGEVATDVLAIGNGVPAYFAEQLFTQIVNSLDKNYHNCGNLRQKAEGKRQKKYTTKCGEQQAHSALQGESLGGNFQSMKIADKNQQLPQAKAKPLTFAHTSTELLSGRKTVTRRNWKDITASTFTKYFEEGRLIPAYDRHPRNKGNQIALIKLTQAPYQERLGDMSEKDLLAEGGMCQTVTEFCDRFFKGNQDQVVWVIRFELVSSLEDQLFPKKSAEHKNYHNCGNFSSMKIANFQALDETIKKYSGNEIGFIEKAIALQQIKEQKLYKVVGYKSFFVYCKERHNLGRTYVSNLIKAIPVYQSLPKTIDRDVITESHCRELLRIKDQSVRSQVINNLSQATITAKAIREEYLTVSQKAIAQKEPPELPPKNAIIRLTSKYHHDLKHYKDYWGIITEVNEFTCLCSVLGKDNLLVSPGDYQVINADDEVYQEFAIAFLKRLNDIYHHPITNHVAKGVIEGLASNLPEKPDRMTSAILIAINIRIIEHNMMNAQKETPEQLELQKTQG